MFTTQIHFNKENKQNKRLRNQATQPTNLIQGVDGAEHERRRHYQEGRQLKTIMTYCDSAVKSNVTENFKNFNERTIRNAYINKRTLF